MNPRDTIVAIATPPGRGGIGVVRLSGERSREIASRILKMSARTPWEPWTARLAALPAADGGVIDEVIATWFAAPRSYTAEDVVEISCHGSPVILRHCVERACSAGARPAEPGEFTLRAFLNGRLDLPRAEAVRDLIEATTLYQARVAARQAEGGLSRRIAPLKQQLLELIALLEAGIDFAEDDVDVATAGEIARRLDPIERELDRLVASFAYGRLVHDGFALAIVGRPNVGKSSLFNRLLEQDRAIVTDVAGTTRDLVSETAAILGIPVRLIDTAGIRSGLGDSGPDRVERLGIERTYQAMADADLTLVVLDLSVPRTAADAALIERAAAQGRHVVAGNKCDLAPSAPADGLVRVSAVTGEGIEALRRELAGALSPGGVAAGEEPFLTSLRHEQLLRESLEAIRNGRTALGHGLPHEMLLLDFYAALTPIDALTGATTADDILNRIFSTFCIGK